MNKLTLVGILVVSLVILVLGYALYQTYVTNPRVIRELLENPQDETAKRVMLINFPSGKMLPVNFLYKHEKYWAAADGTWWRDLREPGLNLSIIVEGNSLDVHAVAIEDNERLVEEIFSELRPTAPRWVGAILVEFTTAASN